MDSKHSFQGIIPEKYSSLSQRIQRGSSELGANLALRTTRVFIRDRGYQCLGQIPSFPFEES